MADQNTQTNNSFTVLVDADIFVAWAKETDSNHERASQLYRQLEEQPVSFITSNYVFTEAVTVISQRVSHAAAIDFIAAMKMTQVLFQIQWIDEQIEEHAIAKFKAQNSKNVSFVDCTNMALVDHYQIGYILSFDEVYRRNGYTTLAETT